MNKPTSLVRAACLSSAIIGAASKYDSRRATQDNSQKRELVYSSVLRYCSVETVFLMSTSTTRTLLLLKLG